MRSKRTTADTQMHYMTVVCDNLYWMKINENDVFMYLLLVKRVAFVAFVWPIK